MYGDHCGEFVCGPWGLKVNQHQGKVAAVSF